jgi:precorrin-8X/cobalt-precorrin-8 methylmutase
MVPWLPWSRPTLAGTLPFRVDPSANPPPAPRALADHPIFLESLRRVRALLGETGLPPAERDVLERLVHSVGDPAIAPDLRFSAGACAAGLRALAAGGVILTDTAMAAAAVAPMARRTFANPVLSVLEWAPATAAPGSTRAAAGMARALAAHPAAVVLVGSAPTALECLLDLCAGGVLAPALVIGMPVGFVGVAESKRRLAASGLPQIRLEGSRGGAALVAAAANALLRRAWLEGSQA